MNMFFNPLYELIGIAIMVGLFLYYEIRTRMLK